MKVVKTSFSVFLTLCLIISLTSCATIMHGGRQDVSVISDPAGATVTVDNIKVKTPDVINLDRKKQVYVLRFEKEGYEPVEVKLQRATDGWVWGNILLGGLIGLAIDYSTGAAYKLTPDEVEVVLKKRGYSLNTLKDKNNLLVCVDMEELIEPN